MQKNTLPAPKKVPILTTATDDWIPLVAEVLTHPQKHKTKTVILQCGDGPYIIAGGFYFKKTGPEILQLINRQKSRPSQQLIALGIPREEMAIWTSDSHKTLVKSVTSALKKEVFGVIAPAREDLPDWLTKYDRIHGIREKLMVWTDKNDTGPTAKLYRYIRKTMGIPPDRFLLLCTSANKTGMGTNIRFAPTYDQLGDEESIAYAVYDTKESKYKKGSPPIISVLPFTIGYNKFLVVRSRRGIEDLQKFIHEVDKKTRLGYLLYAIRAFHYRTMRLFYQKLRNLATV